MVNTSARQAGDPGFDSRVAQQNLLFILGTFTFWHCNCRGPSADSIQIEHPSSVQHKGNPNHSTYKIKFIELMAVPGLTGFRSIKPFKEHISKHKSSLEKRSNTKCVSIVT